MNAKPIIHLPHSQTDIPREYLKLFEISTSELERELLSMTDSYTDELFANTGNSLIFPISRLICDVERFRSEKDELMSSRGMWVCYTKTSGMNVLKTITPDHKNEILAKYYDVHHRTLTEMVRTQLNHFGKCLIIDGHSFPSVKLAYEFDQEPGERPEICIGTDDFHTPLWLKRKCMDAFQDLNYRVAENVPFSGSIVPLDFYNKQANVATVMIEINRKVYLDEKTGQKTQGFDKIHNDLIEIIKLLSEQFYG